MSSSVLGFDIGGANLKMAHVSGMVAQQPFPLWKQPNQLAGALRQLIAQAPPFDRIAATMTGELCDCFETKQQGVGTIVDAILEAAGECPVLIWTTDGCFIDPAFARREWLKVAAANWLATATWASRFAPGGTALLIDTGSTTTDIIPLRHGRPTPTGVTDPERLESGELVYTGARRTPVCALLNGRGMAELFATTLDVYLLLGRRSEAPNDRDTADGRPATRAFAHARLARMLGGDGELTGVDETQRLADQIAARQSELILAAMTRVTARLPQPPNTMITAGSGEFVVEAVIESAPDFRGIRRMSLGSRLSPALSQAICAYAVAVLASEAG
jgi:probable H4MPT-linked C1 transfer pathway protein